MSNQIKTTTRTWASIGEYEDELLGFSALSGDLVISGTPLSAATINYILQQAETIGEYIGHFPTFHPIFVHIAKSNMITLKTANKIIELSLGNPKVYEALATNDVLSEAERITYALSA
jgi:hypothetical protein